MRNNSKSLMVSIWCITYNHEPYIRQCLDGFVMQKTNFRFEAIVHDDASIDGTAAIVREYAEKYPDIIKPIFETENQWSKQDGAIDRIMEESCTGKYIALCEGDDYWIDPLKLQKQVDYLEGHPKCTMTCHRGALFSNYTRKMVGEVYCRHNNGQLDTEDVINKTGLYIPTCSILCRPFLIKCTPDYCKNCGIGDYPLQIFAAMNGNIYYYDQVMSVYRIDNSGSWSGKQNFYTVSPKRLHDVRAQKEMLQGFSADYPQFAQVFKNKIAEHINRNMPLWNASKRDKKLYVDLFSEDIAQFSFFWKICMYFFLIPFPFFRQVFQAIFLRKYKDLQKVSIRYRILRKIVTVR